MTNEDREISMRKPDESLEDFIVGPVQIMEPPLPVLLRRTGEIEVLRPLAVWERPAKLVPARAPYRFSWFHRSLAVGGGLAMIALVLLSAIFIGIADQRASEVGDIAFIEVPDDNATVSDELKSSDIFNIPDQQAAVFEPRAIVRRSKNAARTRMRVLRPAARPAVKELEPQITVAKFSPTTRIIYIENGVVRSRVEPWNRSASFSN
jgi:hypothetical protein